MIGFMDGAGTVWVGQRGDNGIWFSIGQIHCRVNETIMYSQNNTTGQYHVAKENEGSLKKIGLFDPHVLEYKKRFALNLSFSFLNNRLTTIMLDALVVVPEPVNLKCGFTTVMKD